MGEVLGNEFAQAARWTKAWLLVRYCRRAGYDADDVSGWDDFQWALASARAGAKSPPSILTQSLTVNLLTESGYERPQQ